VRAAERNPNDIIIVSGKTYSNLSPASDDALSRADPTLNIKPRYFANQPTIARCSVSVRLSGGSSSPQPRRRIGTC
jgi:hypothetical protein